MSPNDDVSRRPPPPTSRQPGGNGATTDTGEGGRRAEWALVSIGLVLPSVIVWLYFYQLSGAATWVQQSTYTAGKVVQFGLPLAGWWVTRHHWPRLPLRPWSSAVGGLASGILILVACWAAYVWLDAGSSFQSVGPVIQGRIAGFGITSLGSYVLLAAFYALIHSFLEEYYWRWFVFGRLRGLMGHWPAIAVSSVGFAAHHVIVLSVYFGWGSPAALWLSLGVAVGGVIWAWQYHRSRSLVGVWVSHLMADLAVFAVGYDLMRPFITG